jgi:hypothetical protein
MISHQAPDDATNLLTTPSGSSVAAEAIQSVFGMAPHAWQEEAISHIIALVKDDSCAPLFLV